MRRSVPTSILLLLLFIVGSTAEKDYYKILGVTRDTKPAGIKRAFRKLSLKYHPDKNQGSEEARLKYLEISEAYDILSNPDKKDMYDQHGEEGLKNFGKPQAQDPFAALFGGGKQQGNRNKGPNFSTEYKVTLEELYLGAERKFSIKRKILCSECRGTGAEGGKTKKCRHCKGKGVVMKMQRLGPGFNVQMQAPCDKCSGKGQTALKKCKKCRGSKQENEVKKLDVFIERGMPDGHEIVFERASEHQPGMIPGDVVLKLKTQKHKTFKRAGNDLEMEMHISLLQSLTGFSTKIKRLDGTHLTLNIPGVTSPGFEKIVKGEGMPHHNFPSDRGDLKVRFLVDFPSVLTSTQKEGVRKILT